MMFYVGITFVNIIYNNLPLSRLFRLMHEKIMIRRSGVNLYTDQD